MTGYSDQFYRDLENTALPSARRIVPIVVDLIAPQSVVDLGCGDGSWLSVFREHGASRILGFDGEWVDERRLRIPLADFRRAKLDRPVVADGRFDLAMSLEVAEHLPESRAAGFVADMTTLAPVVLFSAAIPEEGGLHHVNERWPSYWAELFAAQGFRAVDILRWRVWNDPRVTWWYKQNLLLFAHDDALARHPRLQAALAAAPQEPIAVVHPDRFVDAVRLTRPRFGRWLKMAPDVVRRSLRRVGRNH
jgi:Methyltransferase domain